MEKKTIPAEILLNKLKEKNINSNVSFSIKSENDKEVEFSYSDNEKSKIDPLTHLISIAEENNLLYDFIVSNEISLVAQKINTENDIILKILIDKDKFQYVYDRDRLDIAKRYQIDGDFNGESLFNMLKKYYDIEELSVDDAYSYLTFIRK